MVGEVAAIRSKVHEIRSELAEIRYRQNDIHARVGGLEESGAGRDHEKRLNHLEEFDPAVTAERLRTLTNDVQGLKRAFYTFAFGVVGSAIVFAFTVFSLLGK